ncbi:MAG: NnrU family protein [Bosea sp. (in: a-proteobacteria)]|uniref:NnrU family protein n=1 Tax=Bosea sp. (in: a-proteobacteria) TaxID=1871050 RepID=UPI002734FB1A|nr:NnrU family protein [Bosea sp. (in: a-proteobacteria)]MDP3601355.1 NnrU family protein [Bosea sp. (in: a-proteobacteria)]
MLLLILGLVLFLGMHAVTMKRDLRAQLIERFGAGGYRGLYSAVSILGFLLLIYGYGLQRAAGYTIVWEPPVWTRHLALLLNLPIFILLAIGRRPSWLLSRVKHPMLLAVKIWATAHLLANGDLGSMLLFGGFLAWAVMARISVKRRPEEIARAAAMTNVAFGRRDVIAIVAGLVLYVVFALWLHPLLIGVSVTGR